MNFSGHWIFAKARYYYAYIHRGARISKSVFIGKNSCIYPSEISGKSSVGEASHILSGSKLSNVNIGDSCIVEEKVFLFDSTLCDYSSVHTQSHLKDLQLGVGSYIARNCKLEGVTIGNFCSIGPELLAGTGEHPIDRMTTSPVFYSNRKTSGLTLCDDDFNDRSRIEIGSDVWIGARVFLRDGIKVGHGAIIAAGAVVTSDVPPYTIVGGVPAKIIRSRFVDSVKSKLLEIAWWDWSIDKLREASPILAKKNTNTDAFIHELENL